MKLHENEAYLSKGKFTRALTWKRKWINFWSTYFLKGWNLQGLLH